MQRLVLSSKKNQPFKSLIFGSCGWHISLIDSEMSAVTLALAIIIVILLYLLFKKYGSEAPSTSSSKMSIESLAEKNRYTEEEQKRIRSGEFTKESSAKVVGSKEAMGTKLAGSKESNIESDENRGKKDIALELQVSATQRIESDLSTAKGKSKQSSSANNIKGTSKENVSDPNLSTAKTKSKGDSAAEKGGEPDLSTAKSKSDLSMTKTKSKEGTPMSNTKDKSKEKVAEGDLSTAKEKSKGGATGSEMSAAKKSKEATARDLSTAKRNAQEGNSKEWGPMGKQKIRQVPPWRMEGEVYYPPNFWMEEKRTRQSNRRI
uniref:Testis expressed 264, ER-phagy receptor a n=1 Tax=Ascaris lumbricoides TaxID=6252 RepID=A0A0M3ICB9_ASCLU